MVIEIIVGLIILGAALYFYNEYKTKAKANSVAPTVNAYPFPCVIEGSIDYSPMPDRVKALAIEAASKGIVITGDYATDVAAQEGEMTLAGAFKFTIDAQGQRVESQSFVNLFGVEYPITGGIEANGNLGMAGAGGAGGTSITGSIVNGQLVNGRIHKGLLPHIYGVLNGTVVK